MNKQKIKVIKTNTKFFKRLCHFIKDYGRLNIIETKALITFKEEVAASAGKLYEKFGLRDTEKSKTINLRIVCQNIVNNPKDYTEEDLEKLFKIYASEQNNK